MISKVKNEVFMESSCNHIIDTDDFTLSYCMSRQLKYDIDIYLLKEI